MCVLAPSTGKKIAHRKAKKNDKNDLTIETIENERCFAALQQNFSIVSIVVRHEALY